MAVRVIVLDSRRVVSFDALRKLCLEKFGFGNFEIAFSVSLSLPNSVARYR